MTDETEKYLNATGFDSISKWVRIRNCHNCQYYEEEEIKEGFFNKHSRRYLIQCKKQGKIFREDRNHHGWCDESWRLYNTCPLPSCDEYQLKKGGIMDNQRIHELEEENRRLKLKLNKDIEKYFCERISSLEKRVEELEEYKERQIKHEENKRKWETRIPRVDIRP